MAINSLATNIGQAVNDFAAIKVAIEEKGVPVPSGTPTKDYDDLIRQIKSGENVETIMDAGINILRVCNKGVGWDTIDGTCKAFTEQIQDGSRSFTGNTNLSEVTADFTNMRIGNYMFQNCTRLTNFKASLESLQDGTNMFLGCDNLTIDSLLHILNSIPDRSETWTSTLTIGSINKSKLTPEQIAIATNKNWIVN